MFPFLWVTWLCPRSCSLSLMFFFLIVGFDEHVHAVFAAHASDGRYDYLTTSGKEHIVRLTEAGSETRVLSHIQVSRSEGLAKSPD